MQSAHAQAQIDPGQTSHFQSFLAGDRQSLLFIRTQGNQIISLNILIRHKPHNCHLRIVFYLIDIGAHLHMGASAFLPFTGLLEHIRLLFQLPKPLLYFLIAGSELGDLHGHPVLCLRFMDQDTDPGISVLFLPAGSQYTKTQEEH